MHDETLASSVSYAHNLDELNGVVFVCDLFTNDHRPSRTEMEEI